MKTLLPLLFAIGCSGKTPPQPEPPTPTPVEAPAPAPTHDLTLTPPANPGCFDACMRDSMAQPRAPEAIEADCKAQCNGPVTVRDGKELVTLTGRKIRITGTVFEGDYPTAGKGSGIRLDVGGTVWLAMEGVPAGWEDLVGKRVTVAGTLTQGPTSGGQRIRIPFLSDPEKPSLGNAPL